MSSGAGRHLGDRASRQVHVHVPPGGVARQAGAAPRPPAGRAAQPRQRLGVASHPRQRDAGRLLQHLPHLCRQGRARVKSRAGVGGRGGGGGL